jgi:WXG100 family type VII secretion target
MTAFRVTPAELMSLSQQVNGTAGQIESELGTLRSRVVPISGTWAGQAQDRFQALYDDWNRNAQGLQQALAGISQLLSQAGQGYDDAERRIATSFAG